MAKHQCTLNTLKKKKKTNDKTVEKKKKAILITEKNESKMNVRRIDSESEDD